MIITRLGKFERKLKRKKLLELDIADLETGINIFSDVFICLDEDKNIKYVINRTCDHNGGKLIKKNDCAVCPLHGWKLNFSTLEYDNSHIKKKKLDYSVQNGKLIIPIEEYKIENPFLYREKNQQFTVRWLNHATLYFEFEGFKIVTDPWLFGPAFMNGWWLETPSTIDSTDLLENCDLIFISHNHPDHLHPETLAVLNKNIPIITGAFQSSSSRKMLERCGFKNISELDFKDIFQFDNGVQLSILKSGDFRDDSGLYLAIGEKEILLTVDANFLNSFELPENIFLLATSFAGGASGFPLCFLDYTDEEKISIIKRNKAALKSKVFDIVKQTSPKYYLPYAGMFKEYAHRDSYIQNNNLKNQIEDYFFLDKYAGCTLLVPDNKTKWVAENDCLRKETIEKAYFQKEDTLYYINQYKEVYQWDFEKIISYFKSSGFQSNIILQIVPTDDLFEPISNHYIYADFLNNSFNIKPLVELIESLANYRLETIFVRQEAFMCIIENKLPWEDISIGFQIRVKRNPNQYNSDFWYHFTNEYISGENYRHSIYCGACSIIEQNPIWQNQSI